MGLIIKDIPTRSKDGLRYRTYLFNHHLTSILYRIVYRTLNDTINYHI